MKNTSIGGQGVLEGVMMRSEEVTGIAVRKENKDIATQAKPTKALAQKYKFFKIPIIRGFVNFIEILILGVKTITDAVKLYDPEFDEEPSKTEEFIAKKMNKNPMDVAVFMAVIIAVVLAVGLFFILPNVLTSFLTTNLGDVSFLKNLVDGGVRIVIFIIYLAIISNMKDIKRLFGYHGAEHKVINCFESEQPLDVEHAKQCSRLHPRCGTSFLLIVMTISILLFSLLGWSDNWFLRIGLRLLMLPVVAGVSYEILKLIAKASKNNYKNIIIKMLLAPGLALQRLTTREPEDEMIEVAIVAFIIAQNEKTPEEIEELRKSYSHMETTEETPIANEEELVKQG